MTVAIPTGFCLTIFLINTRMKVLKNSHPDDDDEELTMLIPTMGGDDIVLLYSVTARGLLDDCITSILTILSSLDGFLVIAELGGPASDLCIGVSGSDTARVSWKVFGTV